MPFFTSPQIRKLQNALGIRLVVALLTSALVTLGANDCLADGRSAGRDVERVRTHSPNLSAEQVWKPEIEELEWSEVSPSSIDEHWIQPNEEGSDQVVVRGVAGSESAIRIAAAKLILPRLSQSLRINSPWDRHFAMKRIMRELQQSGSELISDQVSQTFYRSVGNDQIAAFTREAILLDLSTDKLNKLRHQVRGTVRHNRRVVGETLTLAMVAFLVTCVTCWVGSRFFDRLTQGYYVWPIRIATTCLLLVSVGITMNFALVVLRSL